MDSTFYSFFPQKVVSGSLEDAMVGPDRVVLTEPFAKRLFGHNSGLMTTNTYLDSFATNIIDEAAKVL